MALEQKLGLKMSQRLVMTPSLQQAIKLLQMSKLELVEEVQQELLENPVLEESAASEDGEPERETAEETAETDPYAEIDYESYFQDVDADYTPRAPREVRDDLPTFENTLASKPNLADHLNWQLDMSAHGDTVKEVGRAIIGNINEDGYLRATLEEIQQIGDYEREEVEQTLKLVQGFDPVG